MQYADRRDAGRRLASQLLDLAGQNPIVVALPRGGVPVGFEVARALGAPLDILAVRKLGAPGNPEFAVGAIAEGGTAVISSFIARRVGLTAPALDATVARESAELQRRVERYRAGRPPVDVRGRVVIVVDDGLATGLTDLAAVRALRARGAAKVIVAIPVGSRESIALLGREADEVVCPTIPRELVGVGRWYRDFTAVSDDEVLALLDSLPAAATAAPNGGSAPQLRELTLPIGDAVLGGDLAIPPHAGGLVIFAHGSGSSRLSPRNRAVAETLTAAGLATLLFDLLTAQEAQRREPVFDIPLLARRLEGVTRWASENPATRELPIGYFGASTGAAAAMRAAAALGERVRAVVSRGGRPDLAADRLARVSAATLLIIGGLDAETLERNRRAQALLTCPNQLIVVDGADHLFSQPGALEEVALLAGSWFGQHLPAPRLTAAP